MAVMRLIRLPNLLIILFTLYSIRHLILGPVLASWGMSLNITHFDFSLLSFSIVLIAAGGYVINDYFDQKTDRINRPGEVIVGRSIPRRTAMAAHIILNTIGVLAGIYLSWKYGLFILGSMIFIFTSSALWFYSVDFKKRMLVGNLVIAILAGLIPLLPLVYETPLLGKNYRDVFLANHHSFSSLIKIIGVFSFFAFWFTLAREIVKDMEDFEGDLAAGGKTLPIRAGKKTSTWIVFILSLAGFILLTIGQIALYDSYGGFWASTYIALLQILLILFLWLLFKASSPAEYRKAGTVLKIFMLAGISFCFVFWWLLKSGIWELS